MQRGTEGPKGRQGGKLVKEGRIRHLGPGVLRVLPESHPGIEPRQVQCWVVHSFIQ